MQPIAKKPQQQASGSGIITYQNSKAEAMALAPQHNSRVVKRPPGMDSTRARALLQAMAPEALAQPSIKAQAPVQPQPTAAPDAHFVDEAIVIDEAPPLAPATTSEAAPTEQNLLDTPAARAIPPDIDQERLDKLLVCRHWSWLHKISLCQQVEIMAGNRGKDHTTWCQRLIRRYESRGLWNVYEIDGFLYEVDLDKGEAKGIPRREYIKMVDRVKRKCCAPVVVEVEEVEEDVEEDSEEEDEGEEGEEDEEEDEGEEGEEQEEEQDEDEEGDEEGKEESEDEVVGEDGEPNKEEDREEDRHEKQKHEEDVADMEVVQDKGVVEMVEEVFHAPAESGRSFLDLLDDNGDVLPLEAWDKELRDSLMV
ncbi:hypothetical protein M419DRAFT_5297 [Trichoderma reesei RUT C-30]|uniref:Uncharacterized protein n=1 Tax=Hypocrea jecorina (strain ATCC 56765 / BCRC 32924 / NRRL 11460 / Rut C-30) TaxID=1344414 RepID=A0A024SMK4_HYPJR|nr:hypothetical protein M419DRAFT_5297 [Trichoderma reesei RUT C-30]